MSSINPYNTQEPYVWAGDYLLFRGKVVGMIEYEDRTDTPQHWHAVTFVDQGGRLVWTGTTHERSFDKAGAMLRLQDWLSKMIRVLTRAADAGEAV